MAKKSKIVKNDQRAVVVARYAERRRELKAQIKDTATSYEDRAGAVRALSRLPRDSSPVRLRNRDVADGRPRGYIRKAGLSRIRFRDMAHRGELPGITKSSW
jgi:small subunit ribosomal protein S14